MSHLTSIAVTLKDIDMITAACGMLGWTVHVGGKVKFYAGDGPACDYTITMDSERYLAGHYTLGLQRQADGTFRILCDNSMRGPVILEEGKIGGDTPRILNALRQQYSVAIVYKQAERMGARVAQQRLPNGKIALTVRGGRI